MKRSLSLLLILALLMTGAVIFTGCSDDKEDSGEYPVVIGEVTIRQEPQKVVVLDDSFADMISYMGYDRKIAARSDECDQEFLKFYPSVGSAADPSAADILRAKADLVIASGALSDAVKSELAKNEIPVVTLSRVKSFAGVKELYSLLGTVMGGNKAGAAKGETAYNKLISTLLEYKAVPLDVVKYAVYLYLDEDGQLCTFTEGSFEQQLFGYNGAINSLSHQQEPQISDDELRRSTPSCIFYDSDAVTDYLRGSESLQKMQAVRGSCFCRIPYRDFFRYGTSCEQIIYDMVNYLKESSKSDTSATIDEATPDEAYPDDTDDPWDSDGEDDDYDDDSYTDSYYEDDEDDYSDYSDDSDDGWDE